MKLISRKTLLLFFLPGAVFMGAFLIYPICKMVFDSFFKIGITGDRTFIGLSNYIKAFSGSGMLKQLKNTLIYILVAVGFETVFGFLFALLFELDYKGSKIVRSLMMTPLMIAPLVAGLTWKLMMSSSFGIVNELLTRIGILSSSSDILWLADSKWSLLACCISDIWLTTPFMMLMILAGLQGLDSSTTEAARIDGAGKLQQFRHITLPLIKPMAKISITMSCIGSLKFFDLIYNMTKGGPSHKTEVLASHLYNQAFGNMRFGYASAISIVIMVLCVVVAGLVNILIPVEE